MEADILLSSRRFAERNTASYEREATRVRDIRSRDAFLLAPQQYAALFIAFGSCTRAAWSSAERNTGSGRRQIRAIMAKI